MMARGIDTEMVLGWTVKGVVGYAVYQAGLKGKLGKAMQTLALEIQEVLGGKPSGSGAPGAPAPPPPPPPPGPSIVHTLALTDIQGNLLQWRAGTVCRADIAGFCYHQWDVFYSQQDTGEGLVLYQWDGGRTLTRMDTGGRFDIEIFFVN